MLELGEKHSDMTYPETKIFLYVLTIQSFPTLCDPLNCSPPDSSAHGILQARILEWAAFSFSRASSPPRDWTLVSCIAGRFLTAEPPGKPYIAGASIPTLSSLVGQPRLPQAHRQAEPHSLWSLNRPRNRASGRFVTSALACQGAAASHHPTKMPRFPHWRALPGSVQERLLRGQGWQGCRRLLHPCWASLLAQRSWGPGRKGRGLGTEEVMVEHAWPKGSYWPPRVFSLCSAASCLLFHQTLFKIYPSGAIGSELCGRSYLQDCSV